MAKPNKERKDVESLLKGVRNLAGSVQLSRYVTNGNEIESRRGKTQLIGSAEDIYEVTVIDKGRIGTATFYNADQLEEKTRFAISLSRYAEELDLDFPSKKRVRKAKVYDSRIERIDAKGIGRMMESMHSTVDKRTEILESSVSATEREMEIANTNGVHLSERRTNLGAMVSVKSDKGGVGYEFKSSRLLFDPADIGRKASEFAISQEGTRTVSPGRYRIVFEKHALSTVLDEMLLQFFFGRAVANSKTFLHDKLGQRVFSDDLTLVDAPFEPGTGARSFDSDGNPSAEKILVENGTVRNFLFGIESLALAKKRKVAKIGTQTAGNSAGASNVKVMPGDIADLTSEGNVILIRSFLGAHSINASNGQFNMVVDTGYYMKDGEVVHPVNGAAIGANMIDLFKSPLIEKKTRRFGNIVSPRIGFDDVNCV